MMSNKMFAKYLNYAAAIIILIIIIVLVSRINYLEKREVTYVVRHYSINPKEIITKDKSIIMSSIDSLNAQVNELKKMKVEFDEIQKKNNEEFRFYLAIIGAIFAIVGFFGFKSIHDTRQAAIERAVNEAKNEAIKEAREASKSEAKIASITEARNVAESTSKQIAENTAIETSKNETAKFLSDEFPKQFRIQEEKYTSSFTEELGKVSNDVDILKNPEAYGRKTKMEIRLQEDVEKLKLKYDELLDLITNIKIKFLKDEREG